MMIERLMADFACLDPVYVDGIAGIVNLGTNFAQCFFRWQIVSAGAYERVPAVYLIRPRSSIQCTAAGCAFWSALERQAAPQQTSVRMVAH